MTEQEKSNNIYIYICVCVCVCVMLEVEALLKLDVFKMGRIKRTLHLDKWTTKSRPY
jgi:hypothetical protein